MTSWSVAFAPVVPWWAIAVLAVLAAVLVGLSLWRRARGGWLRLAAFLLLLAGLARPQWLEEVRALHQDVAVVVVDRSPSQAIGERAAVRDAALAAIRAEAGRLDNLVLREVSAGEPNAQKPGTRLFDAWRRAVADVPPGRRAGVILLSDGQVHDAPDPAEETGPVHLLLTGEPGEQDRRLRLHQAPRYGIVGEPVVVDVQVDDLGVETPPASARLTVRRDGEVVAEPVVRTGERTEIAVPLVRAGTSVLDISVAEGPAELTLRNNRVVASVNAVRDRLRVLLISGHPHAGERVWRNLLKSDPSVDLVHFTILRPPSKQDATPVGELALISFPVRELFLEKLHEFDLIVFDRYTRRGLIAPPYLANIADFAENGGAVLLAAGPSYADDYVSLHDGPVGDIMPAEPTREVLEAGFRPQVSALGRRHPVTQGLGAEDSWGRWFRQIEADAGAGQVVMEGIDGRPLLVLSRVGDPAKEGRVAQLLSDHIWLWARGYEGGGPHGELLRRLAHWLMKEPELEEEALSARPLGSELLVEQRTLRPEPEPVRVVGPGGVAEAVAMVEAEPGRFVGRMPLQGDGLYRIEDGQRSVVVPVGIMDALELQDARASVEPLEPVLAESAGSHHWLRSRGLVSGGLGARASVPQLRMVSPGRTASGRNWIGLRANQSHTVVGLDQRPILPAWLMLALAAAVLAGMWWREGR